MDARSDDSSAGSDSLDKSLQRKCVVDDMGQGEGKQHTESEAAAAAAATTVEITDDQQQQQQCSIDNGNRTATQNQHIKTDKIDKIVGDASEASAIKVEPQDAMKCDLNESGGARVSPATNNTHNNAFETKVTQISKNLKETTLAEYDVTTRSPVSSASTSTSSSSSSSPSSSTSSSSETEALLGGTASELLDQNSQLSVNSESIDEQDGRSKKVRFHPDVKENDGGNRVIPKKKKKLKNSASGEEEGACANASGSGQRSATGGAEDEMDYEEEEDATEEEEEFNLAKTIAEAQNYLKLHPLTFVGSANDKQHGSAMQNGDDLQTQSTESSSEDDEDFCKEMQPECGVERILGKQIKNGKAELLVRFMYAPVLCWESEELIASMCPNMIQQYELNRERRQERLMRHVAKRQNVRQRYTDF